jgi:hypothetical protein
LLLDLLFSLIIPLRLLQLLILALEMIKLHFEGPNLILLDFRLKLQLLALIFHPLDLTIAILGILDVILHLIDTVSQVAYHGFLPLRVLTCDLKFVRERHDLISESLFCVPKLLIRRFKLSDQAELLGVLLDQPL